LDTSSRALAIICDFVIGCTSATVIGIGFACVGTDVNNKTIVVIAKVFLIDIGTSLSP
jgi:high-affinity Fe2+/Pb2+ permease